MSSLYFAALILFIAIEQITAKSSPVLIYGIKFPPRNVFPKITKNEFKQKMGEYVKSHTFFLILVKNFNARQLTCSETKREDCVKEFPSDLEYSYYGAVEKPHQALEELFKVKPEPVNVDKDGKLKSTVVCEIGNQEKLNIVQLADARRRREANADQDLIRRRSTIINDIKQQMAKCDRAPLFFFMDPMSDGIEYENAGGDTSTLLVKSFSTNVIDDLIIVDVITKEHKLFDKSDSELKTLTLKFAKKKGGYTIVNATYDGEEYTSERLKLKKTFTHTPPGLVFSSGNKKLRIDKLELERFTSIAKVTKGIKLSQDDWYTCTYVTPGILMSLFVVAILGSILFFGLSMIMDIKTNDRFDGPQMQGVQFGPVGDT